MIAHRLRLISVQWYDDVTRWRHYRSYLRDVTVGYVTKGRFPLIRGM